MKSPLNLRKPIRMTCYCTGYVIRVSVLNSMKVKLNVLILSYDHKYYVQAEVSNPN